MCNTKFESVTTDLKPLRYVRAMGANTKKINRLLTDKNAENFESKEKRGMTDTPKRE
jgi:hypothetical protein